MCLELITYPVYCCTVIKLSCFLDKLLNIAKQIAMLIREIIIPKNTPKSVMQTEDQPKKDIATLMYAQNRP